MNTKHYQEDRQKREALIQKIGYGKIVKSAVVDKGHPNGPEIHTISSTGIITIMNQKTHKIITRLIARPQQIRRYWENGKAPFYLVKTAIEHQQLGYNYI